MCKLCDAAFPQSLIPGEISWGAAATGVVAGAGLNLFAPRATAKEGWRGA